MNLENKIRSLYQNIYFQKIRVKKLITMLKVIVLDKEYDIQNIAKKSNLSVETVKKYLDSKELILEFLNEIEYIEFLRYINLVKNNTKVQRENEKYELCSNLIKDILETRLKIEQICINNNITKNNFDKLMSEEDYLKENFGEDIIPKIKFRIEETSIIRRSVPRDKKIIEEAWDIKVAKEKIHCLDSYKFKVLKVVSKYFENDTNIELVAQQLQMPVEMVYNYLSDIKTKDIIKENYYNDLQRYLELENILMENDLNAKRDLIIQVVNVLKQVEFEASEAALQLNYPISLINKIINQDLMYIIYDKKEIELIRSSFIREEMQDKKTSRRMS